MLQHGLPEEDVLAMLDSTLGKDLKYDRVLSAMCTHPHPIAIKAHMKFIEANLGDSGLFPGTRELELNVIKMIGELLGNPNACGYITTGGTESNIQALRAARNVAKVGKPNMIVPESAHFSFDKVADILHIEMRKANLDSTFKVDPGSVESLIDKNTIALVGIAGSTEFGQIDPIRKLSEIAIDKGIFLHIDAAFGGFVIPFLDKKYDFDFEVEGVSSITADPHKMGMSTIPSGGLLFREELCLSHLRVETPYLSTNAQHSLVGTRSGASVAATYAVLMHLGREGYREIVKRCMDMTRMTVRGVREIGIEPFIEPVMNVIALDIPKADIVRKELRRLGWMTSVTRKPKGLRLVIMPHTTEETLEMFIRDLERVCRNTKTISIRPYTMKPEDAK